MTTFSPVFLFWYIFPVIVLFAARLLVSVFSLDKRFRIKAPDLSVPFLLYGIHQLSVATFPSSIFPYFLLSLFLLGMGLAFFHAYFYDEIKYDRFFKMYWRSVFLLSIVLYLVLIILNILSVL
ncbi:DUF3397 domain-containing protein [Enterococcus olivae]